MNSKLIPAIFLMAFTMFLVTPSIVSILDESYDVTAFYNFNEENHQKEISKHIQIKMECESIDGQVSLSNERSVHTQFYQIAYATLSTKVYSPPPELNKL